jgi:all-trans-retinol 13,14-reductase
MALVVAGEYRRRSVRIMDCTSLAYFALAAAMAATPAIHILRRYHVVIVWSIFAIVTWATVSIGFPFTTQYAREQAPPEAWGSKRFRRINLVLTTMWGAIFTLGAILGVAILVDGHAFLFGVVIPMIAMGAGYVFSYEYPKRAADRFESVAATPRRA